MLVFKSSILAMLCAPLGGFDQHYGADADDVFSDENSGVGVDGPDTRLRCRVFGLDSPAQ